MNDGLPTTPPDLPPTMLEPVGELDFGEQELTGMSMGDDYVRRTIAVEQARKILTGPGKLFAPDAIPDVGSLIVLADWLLGIEDEAEET